MFLAEGPICCIGTITLLILILGVVLMITGTGSSEQDDSYYQDDYDVYEQDYGSGNEAEGWPASTDHHATIAEQQ
jgi:hypothetical protein